MDGPAIEMIGVRHRYDDAEVLGGIDLRIEPGEIFGFLGHNGTGKTTAINILTTLIPPTSGSARVGGFDVVTERREVTGCIGYLPAAAVPLTLRPPPAWSGETGPERMVWLGGFVGMSDQWPGASRSRRAISIFLSICSRAAACSISVDCPWTSPNSSALRSTW